jgi:predicted nucleic acid-binding protein
MTTAVDTNILVALWDRDHALNTIAQQALEIALSRGQLLIAAPVFAELLACPGRDEPFLTTFFNDTGITVEWVLNEAVWRAAGLAFQAYAAQRRKQRDAGPRRILADFLIGAHALHNKYHLLTLDDRIYRAAFPTLKFAPV